MANSVQVLAGKWSLTADAENVGRKRKWFEAVAPDAMPAPVPGIIQQVFPQSHGVFWYYHRFATGAKRGNHERVLLRFGMVDYLAEVWLNGQSVGGHEGGETPFTLDVTAALRPGAENLLAVRVLNPDNSGIDGIRLDDTPHRNKRCHDQFTPGSGYNTGGILMPVILETVPVVRVTDVFAQAQRDTGRVSLAITVQNDTPAAMPARLVARVAWAAGGPVLTATETTVTAAPGTNEHRLALRIENPRVWDLADPSLYRVTATVTADAGGTPVRHEHGIRFGFREFRVEGGYFHLNGRRVILRSTHTGNHYPIGHVVPPEPGLLRQDLLMAKAAGYNAVRFIAGMAYPEQLDFCDEIGLMVYEECYAAWVLGESPEMARRFDFSVREMILRDRNHPSVTIWGMLNETFDTPVFRHAVSRLPLVRSLDPTRLVLLGSGRWDADPAVGSVSNPGSTAWEAVWGAEGSGAPKPTRAEVDRWPSAPAYTDGGGDVHIYPPLPAPPRMDRLVREVGAGTRPVFLSEYGVGSQFNAIDELRDYDRFDVREDLFERDLIRSMASHFETDWARFGMDALYPFPEDFLRESYRHMVRQRRHVFDLIRSNPKICGYNLTGMLDHALTGEGIWTFWRTWKPGSLDMMRDGWAPLRWCLFVEPRHGYAGRPMTVEAVLANEQVLRVGEYPVVFRIVRRQGGVVWERRATVRVPAPGEKTPLAVPVLNDSLAAGLPAGEYIFAAHLERGGTPAGDRLDFRVASAIDLHGTGATVELLGIEPEIARWLEAEGVACRPFEPGHDGAGTILVGALPSGSAPAGTWEACAARAAAGATVVFLSAAPFIAPPAAAAPGHILPLGDEVKAWTPYDWLYHKDIAVKRHPMFDGLEPGFLDWDVFGPVASSDVFDCRTVPDEVVAAAFALGQTRPGGYYAGVIAGCYRRGRGRMVINALRILGNVGLHPVADRLLLNLIRFAQVAG